MEGKQLRPFRLLHTEKELGGFKQKDFIDGSLDFVLSLDLN